jgi:hypothetical protein
MSPSGFDEDSGLLVIAYTDVFLGGETVGGLHLVMKSVLPLTCDAPTLPWC